MLLCACIFAKTNCSLQGAWAVPGSRLKSSVWLLIVLATDATVGDLLFDASFVLVMPCLWS